LTELIKGYKYISNSLEISNTNSKSNKRPNTLGRKTKKEIQTQKMEHLASVSAAFKALSNETRLAIFECIRLGGGCEATLDKNNRPSVCDVASNFDMALSTISHHFKELRNAGLISCERRGQNIFCQPNEETIRMMVEYLAGKI
jgi:ArsR family transcriptional regulator, arsenate/arsenite/antimonite-responsive transcriptional repressor